ncbi:MAG: hypothetical protein WAN17_08425 [Candidatus Sulfotelmatobacter sp.]
MKSLARALLTVGAGVGLTLAPFLLPISWHSVPMLLHWPILLFDRPNSSLLPLNAGNRLIALFFINVGGWALLLAIFWTVVGSVMRKGKVAVRD